MTTMKIVFKDGQEISVGQNIANKIAEKITSPEGAKKFQIFNDSSTSDLLLAVNLDEVLYIKPDKK